MKQADAQAMGRFGNLRRPSLILALLHFILCIIRVGIVKAMGVLFTDIQTSIPMTSADLGITLGLYYTVGLIMSKYTLKTKMLN